MLVWLLQHFSTFLEKFEQHISGDSRVYLTARTAIAGATSFLLCMIFGPMAIRWLQRRFRERIGSDSEHLNKLHAGKSNTPTMGGLFVMGAVALATLMWGNLSNVFVICGLITTVGFGTLGAADDWIKLSTKRNGLTARTKFATQLLLAIGICGLLCVEMWHKPRGVEVIWPIGNVGIWLGGFYVLWAIVVMVGSSNGVNLTDGLDGLASGCTIFAASAFTVLAYLAGHKTLAEYLSIPHIPGAGELAIVLGALVGAMLGFLWFNCHPAQVFMGDTGSLPIGALLGLAALVTKQEFLLVIVGGIFVVETLSVIAQVAWFKLTGKRLLRCSPLHNHYLFAGEHEMKIVVRFWISSALLALIAIASLKIR
ncbi:MAG: phospho-N-acetylmuramoyl-pentapeptide-transferase [Planctomycetia bacterium]|nr:phospho-N-acetylmuramoyl-pentapeptide-transferase [Planctomycetia bacterium]